MTFFYRYRNIWYGLTVLFILLIGRMCWMRSLFMAFLFWNVFLAVIPLYLSYRVQLAATKWKAGLLAALWLLFFPNSAYLFTDIIHLHHTHHLIYWLDLVILFLGGLYGVVIGILSLKNMEQWYGRLVTPRLKTAITFALFLLCGYGIYLGRVERWNSWDVIAQPYDLLSAMCYHTRHPFRSREVWGMTLVFAASMQMVYMLFTGRKRLW